MIYLNNIISYLKLFGVFISSILIFTFILSLINFISPISQNILNIFSTIFMILLYFILGFKQGKITQKKGWLIGSLWGIIFVSIILISSTIFCINKINIASVIYYIILILTTIFGAIIGINKKKEN